MQIQLPEAGVKFFFAFLSSTLFLFSLLFLLFFLTLALREHRPLWKPATPLTLPGWHFLLPLLFWLGADFLAGYSGLQVNQMTYLFLRDLFTFGIIFGTVSWFGGQSKQSNIGGRFQPCGKLVLLGLGAFLLLGLAFWGGSVIWPFSVNLQPNQLSPSNLGRGILICLLIPLLEELIFRAYGYRLLRARFGQTTGIIGISVIFALLHAPTGGLIFIFLGGLIMTFLFEVTGSILPGLVLHASFNFLLTQGSFWL